MVTEEEPSDKELASEMVPVPEVHEEEILLNEIPNQLDDVNRTKKSRTRKKNLHASIRKQIEFYFSDANLSRDRFLSNLVKENPMVDIEVFVKFNKIRALTVDPMRIAKALQDSSMLKVSKDGTKVYRVTPIGVKENSDECTIYVQRLPRDADHEMLNSWFSQYGSIAYISIPKYKQSQSVKGFAFVEFDKPEYAEKCLKAFRIKGYELPSETSPSHVLSITTYKESENKESITSETNLLIDKKEENSENKDTDDFKNIESEAKNEILVENIDENFEEKIKSRKRKDDTQEIENKRIKLAKIKKIESNKEDDNIENSIVKQESENTKRGNKKIKMIEETNNLVVNEIDVNTLLQEKTKIHTENENNDEDKSPKKNKKKRKVAAISDDEIEPPKKLIIEKKIDEPNSENINDNSELKKKKKKNRHKHFRKMEKTDVTDMGLQVMAKKDWKKLRNKYLDLQRSKMHQLKQHLYKSRRNQRCTSEKLKIEQEESDDIKNVGKQNGVCNLTFSPGLIVKVELDQPCLDVQTFKKEFKANSSVKYVDVTEGASIAFIRLDTPEVAKEMIQKSSTEQTLSIIKDEEEKWYWDKMMQDRAEKLSKKVKINQRGRNKLLKKAEKELGKHIKFDEV